MRALLALTLLAGTGAAFAQQPGVAAPEAAAAASTQGPADTDEAAVNQLLVYGSDPCPASTDDTINVCARLPEAERFRIPPRLRNDPNDRRGQAWAVQAQQLEYVGRTGIGSCSPAGPGGMIGCQEQLFQQARAERGGADIVNWERLIADARQQRLGRIDAAAAADEDDARVAEGRDPIAQPAPTTPQTPR